MREAKSYCRICSGWCGVVLTIDENERIVGVRGDKDHPLTRGYACIKGLQAPEAHHGKDRLLRPLRRTAAGGFEEIGLEQALDEIAERLGAVLERHGPEALAAFRGTINVYSAAASQMLPDWLASFGSHGFYTTMTIDQSAKWVTVGRLGMWDAGKQSLDEADVWMLVGSNPLVSLAGPGMMSNPSLTLREAKARGVKLIVVDPRRTETARHADLFLQPKPGEDAALAAGLVHIVLAEGLEDAAFCARHVKDLAGLRAAVAPFTPERVAARAGISADDLRAAARLFAGPGKRGIVHGGTGITMSPRSNLTDHLLECLNVVCGRFRRAGETIPNPGAFAPARPRRAEVIAPLRPWERGPKSRLSGRGMLFGEKMTGELADEILTPGPGQVRALFVDGGNPASAIPDQAKVAEAFAGLDLLVTIDPYMTATARLSHYVLPPKVFFEHADLAPPAYESSFFKLPIAAYAPAVIPPPSGSEVVDDWYVFWALGKRLGRPLSFFGVALDMETPPSWDSLHEILLRHARVRFETIRERPGELLDLAPAVVEPGADDPKARFDVAPADVVAELAQLAAEPSPAAADFGFRLTSRRLRDVSNTMYHALPEMRRRLPYNPAYLNPDDLAELGLADGETARIVSDRGRILAVVRPDAGVRRGVVSMAHGWGGLPDEPDAGRIGACTGLLISTDTGLEAINAMPRQSAVPVRVEKVS